MLGQLASVALVLALFMFVAWRQIQRDRHVLYWALSFAACGVQWLINFGGLITRQPAIYALASLFQIASCIFAVSAARDREGIAHAWQAPAMAGVFAVAASPIVVLVAGPIALITVFVSVFSGTMLGWAGVCVLPRNRPARSSEWAYAATMAAFSLYEIALGVIALPLADIPLGTVTPQLELYRMLLIGGVPVLFIASGFAAVLLIAGDLSERLNQLARTDPLTGVLNRRGIEEHVGILLPNSRRTGEPISIAVCDLDNFKAINDSFGHQAGDAALRTFATLLSRSVRDGDLVGRIGGDEFVVVLPNARADAAGTVMRRLQENLRQIDISGLPEVELRCSFGVAMTGYGAVSFDDVLGLADQALYRAKREGHSRIHVFGSVH